MHRNDGIQFQPVEHPLKTPALEIESLALENDQGSTLILLTLLDVTLTRKLSKRPKNFLLLSILSLIIDEIDVKFRKL